MAITSPITLKTPLSVGLGVQVTQAPGGSFSHDGDLYYGWDFALTSGSMFAVDVLAVADGTVVFIEEGVPDGEAASGSFGDETTPRDPSLGPPGALGNVVTLHHNIGGQDFYSSYLHLKQNTVPLQVGDTVSAGQIIGQVGNTGFRTDTHLHVNIGNTFGSYTNGEGFHFSHYQIAEGPDNVGALLSLIDFVDSPNISGELAVSDAFVSTTEVASSETTGFKVGEEFLINSTTFGGQNRPKIATFADGTFVAIWRDDSTLVPGTSDSSIRGRVFDPDGQASEEFTVTTTIFANENTGVEPVLDVLADGNFVVVWEERDNFSDESPTRIASQVFGSQGQSVSNKETIPSIGGAGALQPSVASLANGGHVVTFNDVYPLSGGTQSGINVVVFDSAGQSDGSITILGASADGIQQESDVVSLADGRFVVTWKDNSQSLEDQSGSAIFGQLFDGSGNTVGQEFLVNQTFQGGQILPVAASLQGGNFVIVWRDSDGGGGSDPTDVSIRARLYSENAQPISDEFTITSTAHGQTLPEVTRLSDGGFVVLWEDGKNIDGSSTAPATLVGQVFDDTGSPLGDNFSVTPTAGSDYRGQATATFLDDNRFAVAWNDYNGTLGDTSHSGVHGQIFDASNVFPTSYDLVPSATTVAEDTELTFTITRSGTLVAETIYFSTWSDTASYAEGDYYSEATGLPFDLPVAFDPGQTEKTVTLNIRADSIADSGEQFRAIIQSSPPSADPSVNLAQTGFITINDIPQSTTYEFSPVTTMAEEGNYVTLTLTRTGDLLAENVWLSTVADQGYANEGDYSGRLNSAVEFATGQTTKTITLQTLDDNAPEPNETFRAIVQRSPDDPTSTFLSDATFTITDNDINTPNWTITVSSPSASEAVGFLTFEVTRTNYSNAETVYLNLDQLSGDGNWFHYNDFDFAPNTSLTFAKDDPTESFIVPIKDDDFQEGVESFRLEVKRYANDPDGAHLASVDFEITDNDTTPQSNTGPLNDNDLFKEFGKIELLSYLASASYKLDERYDDLLRDQYSQHGADSYLKLFQGSLPPLELLTSSDISTLSDDGIFRNENAAALVARSESSLFLAFRGTNDAAIEQLGQRLGIPPPDVRDWFNMDSHYELFADFKLQLDQYISDNVGVIKNIYVTGHSLGASMVQAYMAEKAGDPRFEAVTFADPGYEFFESDFADNRVQTFRIAGDPIFASDITRALGGYQSRIFLDGEEWDYAYHDMTGYLELARFLDEYPKQSGEIHLWMSKDAGGFWNASLRAGPVEANSDSTVPSLLVTGHGNDTLYGSQQGDYLYPGDGDDVVWGFAGNNLFKDGTGGGDDIFNGGIDTDTIDYSSSTLGVMVDLEAPSDQAVGPEVGANQLTSIENVIGGSGNDSISGNAAANRLEGFAGDDVIGGNSGAARDIYDAQVFRLYQTMLARQPDSEGKEFWASQLYDQSLDVVDMAAGFESSTEFQTTYGGLSDSNFVNLLYNNVLDRDADAGGLVYWLGELSGGATRAEVAAGFSESNEFVDLTEETNPFFLSSGMPMGLTDDVFRLYRATLDRDPDMPGLMGWLDFLGTGQTKLSVAEGFVGSTEFQTTYGSLDNEAFVTLLYSNVLDRAPPDAEGLAFWLNELATGATRSEVVLGFSDSSEFIGNTAEAVNSWMRTTPGTANDVLFGGADDDRMFGGFGADSFVFDAGLDGTDIVGDLERWDTLVFNNFGYATEADVLAHITQIGVDTVFSDQGNTVTFQYTTLADLDHADMFSFDDTSLLS